MPQAYGTRHDTAAGGDSATHATTESRRRLGTGALVLAVALAFAASASLSACSDSDMPRKEREPSWKVVNTSESGYAQALANDQTGIQYIAILVDANGNLTRGLCERYAPDGHIMRDGDATKGGSFGLEEISRTDDTITFRDTQTGIAYMWHTWRSESGHEGEGLVVCRDSQGHVLRYDDDSFFPVTEDDAGATGGTGTGGHADSSDDMTDEAGDGKLPHQAADPR